MQDSQVSFIPLFHLGKQMKCDSKDLVADDLEIVGLEANHYSTFITPVCCRQLKQGSEYLREDIQLKID